ncbi:MAG: threonylcarbamoyl-AMP synthase [Alphaproteobacteria bacterium]|nr:threonylcarbamoyl-AMP synthase [Alphaproteobacteria bacterium]
MNNIYEYSAQNMEKAAATIQNGGLVAFPTETVYGLGANVYNAAAVASIFAAKQRPHFDPLISHIAEVDFLNEYAATDERVFALAKRFWPGPLTFVLRRIDENPSIDLACSGLRTLTVRMPNHPIALELIRKSGVPIVAPSANKYQSVSPTTAQHVAEGLGDKVDMILDGGACKVGVESTIIDLTGKKIVMLRAGGTAKEDIEAFLGERIDVSIGSPTIPTAPGQMRRHYAPHNTLRINITEPAQDEYFIGFGAVDGNLNLSPSGNLKEAAANLFAYLRLADTNAEHGKIAVAPIPTSDLGLAINDRLKRASSK